jgi:hypothetical protein
MKGKRYLKLGFLAHKMRLTSDINRIHSVPAAKIPNQNLWNENKRHSLGENLLL